MATGMGVNGFGRIGRLITRIMIKDDDCKLTAINAGSATPDYMAYQYQYKYDTIHGIVKGTVEVEGDFLVLNNRRVRRTVATPRRWGGDCWGHTTSANPRGYSSPRRRPRASSTAGRER